ncbi:MAG: ketopantoate reductase family protein, partial [Thermoplasmatota archaeon]
LGKYDAILLTCKAHQTAALAPVVAKVLEDDGAFATLQNGFGNAQKMALTAAPDHIAVAPLSHGVLLERPGLILHAGGSPAAMGPFVPAAEPAARRIQSLLEHAGLEPQWTDDVRGVVWRKCLVNHAANPVGALHDADNGKLLREPAWSQCREIVEEGYSIARSAGVRLPGASGADALLAAFRATLEHTQANRNSMVQDVAARRPTEIEQISGRLVRLARRLGIAAPHSDEAYRKVKALETRYLGEAAALQAVRDEVAWETEPF